jgi:hypothetical protein
MHRSPVVWRSLARTLAGGLAALSLIAPAMACQICVPLPTQTLADRLLQGGALVLAREDPARPFHFAAVETLKGDPGAAPIDAFLNSQARRRLALDPEAAMLCRRDPKGGKWQALGIAAGDYERVVRRILRFADRWSPGETANLQRLGEFAPLLGHRDLRLHQLAYLEVGRAPYALIRTVSGDVPMERVRTLLDDPRYIEWRGLDILLLGLSGAAEDRDRVIREMEGRQRSSITLNLDAWATAFVEVTGVEGIARLERWYFRDSGRSREELRNIIRALSVHATATPELRAPVVAAYRELAGVHPRSTPDIARDLIAWRQWDFSERLRLLRPQIAERDPLGAYAVSLYLQRAKAHEAAVQD